jgi:hypothetical protein
MLTPKGHGLLREEKVCLTEDREKILLLRGWFRLMKRPKRPKM